MRKTIYLGAAAVMLAIGAAIMVQARSTKTDVARNLQIFNELYKELQTNYVDTLDATKTMRTAIDALLGQIDPYTEYYSAAEQDEIKSISSGEYGGIGSVIMLRDSSIVLSDPRWDSPARRAGLRHGDVLIAIDGDTLPRTFTTPQASARLKGQPGTDVRLLVRRPYVADSIIDVTVTRGTIKIDPVPYYGMLSGGTGYIDITTFSEKTAGAFKNALTELRKNPDFKSLIIDLRGNGGGLLESAVQVASNFVPKGTEIVSTRGRDPRNVKTYKTTSNPVDTKIPIVVLIDGNSASAAEILSGALQDLDRAVIVGERSYGKGLVQNVRPIPYDGIMKVTTGRYYIPSGRLVQAIDYSHRDADGNVTRIPDSLTNIYHTRAGRIVRDGGGITPDVSVDQPDMNRLLYNIVADMWAFDYANRTANTTATTPDPLTWQVSDSMFADFKKFIDPAKFKYDRATESGIKYLREAAKIEGYLNDAVTAQLDSLERLMRHDLQHDLDFNRKEIVEIIDAELGNRWFSEADNIRRRIPAEPEVKEALLILGDPRRYGVLLTPKAEKNGKKD